MNDQRPPRPRGAEDDVSRDVLTSCDVCGDPVAFDDETAPDYVCTCCFGVICPTHTARVTCPHTPADHDTAPGPDDDAEVKP